MKIDGSVKGMSVLENGRTGPNTWAFGRPEKTCDYVTEIWGLKRWNHQQKAVEGDVIFDGCFYYVVGRGGVCYLDHPLYDNLMFKVPPYGFYRWMGTERAMKSEIDKLLESTSTRIQSEIKNVMNEHEVDSLDNLSYMGKKIVEREIAIRIDRIVTENKLKVAQLS